MSSSAFQKQVRTKYIADINQVRTACSIDYLSHQKRKSKVLDSTTTHIWNIKSMKWLKIAFLERLSFKLSRVLKASNFRTNSYTINNVKYFFSKLKDALPPTIHVGHTGGKLHSTHKKLQKRE